MDNELLAILCCPVTHQPLRVADTKELESASASVSKPVLAGLVREDGRMLYPVSQGIPLLLPDEGIPL